jgi:hypothetical protein
MPRRTRTLALLSSLGLAAAGAAAGSVGCEQDVVLPSISSPTLCGDGIVEGNEQCDNPSPGCIDCRIAPDWQCPDNVCSYDCDDPGVTQLGTGCGRTAACNMEGYWAVRETDFTRDPVVGMLQTSTQWYLYHFTQSAGSTRYAVDTVLDCGVHVTGGATSDYTPNTEQYLMYKSGMDEGPHSPRMGTAEATSAGGSGGAPPASGCNVSLDRFFFIRGATAAYLPTDFDNDASLPSSAAEPWLDAPALPAQPPGSMLMDNAHFPTGAVNGDGVSDGGAQYPGIAFRISVTLSGIRHSAQRDYKGYASSSPVKAGALSFTIDGNYSLQESVLATTDCNVLTCALLGEIALPATDVSPYVTFSFVGTDLTSSRSQSVVMGPPKADYSTDLATCANVETILPHDGSIHDGTPTGDASAP